MAKTAQPKTRRRAFIIGGLAALAGGYFLLKQPEAVPAPHTVRTPAERQAYLDQLVQGAEMPHCAGVIYDHDGTAAIAYLREIVSLCNATAAEKETAIRQGSQMFTNGDYDAKTPEVLELAGTGRKSKIFVGKNLFTQQKFSAYTAQDLKHIITMHEYRHAVQHAQGLPWLSVAELKTAHDQNPLGPHIVYSLYELDALADGFKNTNGCSPQFIADMKSEYGKQYSHLQKMYGRSSPLQQKIIRAALNGLKGVDPVK